MSGVDSRGAEVTLPAPPGTLPQHPWYRDVARGLRRRDASGATVDRVLDLALARVAEVGGGPVTSIGDAQAFARAQVLSRADRRPRRTWMLSAAYVLDLAGLLALNIRAHTSGTPGDRAGVLALLVVGFLVVAALGYTLWQDRARNSAADETPGWVVLQTIGLAGVICSNALLVLQPGTR